MPVPSPQKQGFSLLELMVSLSLMTIFVSLAIPGYSNLLQKSRRSDAETSLLALQLAIERYRLSCHQYPTTLGNATLCDTATSTQADGLHTLRFNNNSLKGYYQLNIQPDPINAENSYRLLATATGVQTNDSLCQRFYLDQDNTKTATDLQGQRHDDCWS